MINVVPIAIRPICALWGPGRASAFCTKSRPHFCEFCYLEICAKGGIIIIVKRGYTLRLIQKPKAPTEEQKRRGGRIIQKIF